MKTKPSAWRRFLRRHRQRLRVILILAAINLFTSGASFFGNGDGGSFFPWFLFPAFFIALPIIQDLFDSFVGREEDEEEAGHFEERTEAEEPDLEFETIPGDTASSPSLDDPVSASIQIHLEKARVYQEQIEAFIQATADPRSRARLQDLSKQINEWTDAIESMGDRIHRFQRNTVIRHDLETVPEAIAKLENQLADETDEAIRAELGRTLATRKHQLAALQQLRNTMKQAEIKMESTLAALGTIYSQLLTSQSTDHVADYNRLSAEVNEEVRTLQDHLEALEEVKLGRSSE